MTAPMLPAIFWLTALALGPLDSSSAATLTAAAAVPGASLILTPKAETRVGPQGAEKLRKALSRHPHVTKVSAIFTSAEAKLLRSIGGAKAAQSLRVEIRGSADPIQLSPWIQSRAPGYHVDLNVAGALTQGGSSDPHESLQWYLKNSGEQQPFELSLDTLGYIPGKTGEDVGIANAPAPSGREPVVVAVLDSGVDYNHPDLSDRIRRKPSECEALARYQQCLKDHKPNPARCETEFGAVDTDGNGYAMDCQGWNVAPSDPRTGKPLPAHSVTGVLGNQDSMDKLGHGTHVAGLVAASRDNGLGIRGVAPNVQILPVRVVDSYINDPVVPQSFDLPSPKESDLNPGKQPVFVDVVARGILYALRSGAQVINLSLSWTPWVDSALIRSMISLAHDRGVVIVASAGNDSTDARVMPCSYPGVICVSAHGPDGAISHFSNFGPSVDISAPGLWILSSIPTSIRSYWFQPGYDYKNGTSMAAPLVAGVVARMIDAQVPISEIYPRLIVGARPGYRSSLRPDGLAPKFNRSGNVDLARSLNARPAPVILPPTKDPVTVFWNRKDFRLPMTLRLKNYWAEARDVSVQVRIAATSPASTYASVSAESSSVSLWKSGETRDFALTLDIRDPRVEGRLTLDVSIVGGGADRQFKVPVEISIPLDRLGQAIQGVTEVPIRGELIATSEPMRTLEPIRPAPDGRANYIGIDRSGPRWKLQRVLDRGTHYEALAPWEFDALAPDDGPILQVFEWGAEEVVLILGINPKKPPAGVYGPRFYFVGREGVRDSYANDNRVSELHDRFQWHRASATPETGGAAGPAWVPMWLARGSTPPTELPAFDPWNPNWVDQPEFRIYYADLYGQPSTGSGAKAGATAPTLRSVPIPKGYAVLSQLLPSTEQRRLGEFPILLVQGVDTMTLTYFTAVVRNLQIDSIAPLELQRFRNVLRAPQKAELLNLEPQGGTLGTAISGTSTRNRFRTLFVDTHTGREVADLDFAPLAITDSIVQVLGSYASNQRSAAFVRTFSEIQYHDFARGAAGATSSQIASTTLGNYTFMPSFISDIRLFPIVIARPDLRRERLPGLLIPFMFGDSMAMEVVVPSYDELGGLLGLSKPAAFRLRPTSQCHRIFTPLLGSETQAARAVVACGDRILKVDLTY